MRILWLANTPCGATDRLNPYDSTGGWLRSLDKQLAKHDCIELFVAFYWNYQLKPFLYGKTMYYPIYRIGTKSKILRLLTRVMKLDNDEKDMQLLLQVINRVKPDIIHVHGTEYNYGLIQYYTEIPIVISIQGIISAYIEKFFTGIPFLFAYRFEGIKSKLLFNSIYYQYTNMRRSAKREKIIFSCAKSIIGRTDWDRRITSILAPGSNYFVGHEILRPSFYEKHWYKNEFGSLLKIVTVMSGGLYKGLETIVKIARILGNGIFNFEWIVVGQSESGELAQIVKRWLKADFKELHIDLVGSKSETELVEILLGSDIYCQVSHIENSPNSVCEAMLIGIPIIASFSGGTDSMLENGKEGILVQDGDPYSYAGAIKEVVADYERAIRLGSAASERARIRHDGNTIILDLLKTYKEIML